MRITQMLAAAVAASMLAGCGGSTSPTPTPTAAPTTATLPVTLSTSAATITVGEGESSAFGFTASYTGTSAMPVVADVQLGSSRYQLVGTPAASGSTFTVQLQTRPFAPGGSNSTNVTFRLCTTADCSTVYPGSTKTFAVNLDVRLKDWETFQRDAGHTGYVAVRYKTADFANAWSATSLAGRPTEVAARRGAVFVNTGTFSGGSTATRAFASNTGSQLWAFEFGQAGHFSGPSYHDGRVVSMVMDLSSGNLPMPILSADTGNALGLVHYASQFSDGGPPTPYGSDFFFQAGYYGNVVYAADATTGSEKWEVLPAGAEGVVQQGASVAVDANYVYFFSGGHLAALRRDTGALQTLIRNPYFTHFGLSYFGYYRGAPILDGQGRIVTFTDNRDAGSPLALMAFSLSQSSPLWRTNATYIGHPALRGGQLYAIRANGAVIDTIDATTGNVTASSGVVSVDGDLISNIIVTESHLFVASATTTYALDLTQAGLPVVWTAPRGGALAITPDNLLVVSGVGGVFAYLLAG